MPLQTAWLLLCLLTTTGSTMAESIPPLRVRDADGSPNFIPVFDLVFSGATITRVGAAGAQVRVDSGAGGTGAPEGAPYITWSSNAVLTAERILTAGSSVTIVTDATNVYVNALTGGGATTVYAATGNQYVTISAAADLTDEYTILGSTGISLTSAGNVLYVHYGSLLVTSSRTITAGVGLTGGGNLSADRTLDFSTGATGQYVITSAGSPEGIVWINTAGAGGGPVYAPTGGVYLTYAPDADLTAERIVIAGTGVTVASDGTNFFTSVNTNVRDKTAGFFAGGNLSTTHVAEEARIRIPFNMEVVRVDVGVTTAPTGDSLLVDINQYNAVLGASTSLFANTGNQPTIPATAFVGSGLTFAIGALHAGSFIGFDIDRVGSTGAGSNLTITVVARSS